MNNFLRPIFVVTITALLLVTASIPSDAARRVSGRYAYDGSWSVVVYTLRGDCNRAYRAALRIYGGRVYAEDPSYQAYGAVGRGGAVRVTLVQGGQTAGGAGRLSGNVGRGWWRTTSGECSGQWTAERRLASY